MMTLGKYGLCLILIIFLFGTSLCNAKTTFHWGGSAENQKETKTTSSGKTTTATTSTQLNFAELETPDPSFLDLLRKITPAINASLNSKVPPSLQSFLKSPNQDYSLLFVDPELKVIDRNCAMLSFINLKSAKMEIVIQDLTSKSILHHGIHPFSDLQEKKLDLSPREISLPNLITASDFYNTSFAHPANGLPQYITISYRMESETLYDTQKVNINFMATFKYKP